MNKIYRKMLVQLVDAGMKSHFPEFTLAKFDKHPLRRSADREFVWQVDDSTRIYINVKPHHSGWDDFQCEILWSRKNRYPEMDVRIYSRDDVHEDEGGVDLNALGDTPFSWKIVRVDVPPPKTPVEEFDDYRGLTEDEAMALVQPLVDDMFRALEQFGRPFIQELAAYRQPVGL